MAFVQLMGLKPNISPNSNSSVCARCALIFAMQNIIRNMSKPSGFDGVRAVCGEFCYFPFISRHWNRVVCPLRFSKTAST